MTIEMAIRTGKIIAKETNNVAEAEVLKTLLALAEDYQKVGEGVLPEEEVLSEKVHHAYCKEYKKQKGEEYWTKGDYSKLNEETKDFDRESVKVCLHEIKLRLLKSRMSVDKLGIMIYGILARLPEKEAIEDWTAKHFLSSDKRRSCKLAKSIHKEMGRRLGI